MMRNPFAYCAGGVLSADIAVPDHANELAFYSAVLTTGENPFWRDDLMNNQGTPIIGLGERIPEYEILPLQWTPHFQVEDVAKSVEVALELGGKEIMHGKNEKGESLWAGLSDPDGAAIGLIPVVSEPESSAPSQETFGHISWLSLAIKDANASRDFYQKVLGWTAKETESSSGVSFEMLMANGNVAAELTQYKETSATSSMWLMHIPVGDLQESIERVSENGGEVVQASSDEATAIVRDPVGVIFAIHQG